MRGEREFIPAWIIRSPLFPQKVQDVVREELESVKQPDIFTKINIYARAFKKAAKQLPKRGCHPPTCLEDRLCIAAAALRTAADQNISIKQRNKKLLEYRSKDKELFKVIKYK